MKNRLFILIFGLAMILAVFTLFNRQSQLDVRVQENVDAAEVSACVTTDCKIYVQNNGTGPAHIYLRITMPYFEDAPMDSVFAPHNPLFVYTPNPPWTLLNESIEDDVIISVYYYGEMAQGQTSYFITEWTFNDFAVRNGQCGRYTLSDLYEAVDKINIEGIGVAVAKEADPEAAWYGLGYK